MARKRHTQISGQWVSLRLEMIESPAYRVLSLSAHRVLTRVMSEHCHHGGKENGRLPVTYDQFCKFGLHRHAIAPAIRELEALGFLQITERGRPGPGEFRHPNKFRITLLARTARAASSRPAKRQPSQPRASLRAVT
jgi:hypothetical protein